MGITKLLVIRVVSSVVIIILSSVIVVCIKKKNIYIYICLKNSLK